MHDLRIPLDKKDAAELEASKVVVSHRNVVEVVGYCSARGEIVMECGWHGSFSTLLKGGALPAITVLRILEGAAKAM